MRGCWLGLSSTHTRTDLLHAVLLGVACAARQALDAGGDPTRRRRRGAAARRWRHGICTLAPVVAELGATTTPSSDTALRHDRTFADFRPRLRNAINGAIAVLDRLADRWRAASRTTRWVSTHDRRHSATSWASSAHPSRSVRRARGPPPCSMWWSSTTRLSYELDRNCLPTGSSWAWQARGRRSTAHQRDRYLPAVELADGSKFHGKSSSLPLAAGEGEVSSHSL
jgi:hypothetical protein